jgi:hypothetical protein
MQVQGLLFDAYGTLFISVDEVRTFKPHPAVCALGSARLGLSRDTIGFVSRTAGLSPGPRRSDSRWPGSTGREPRGVTPDLEGFDLKELAEALGR